MGGRRWGNHCRGQGREQGGQHDAQENTCGWNFVNEPTSCGSHLNSLKNVAYIGLNLIVA